MPIAPIRGLFETHLTVADLDRSIAFYRDVLGLELAHVIPARHAAFLWIGGPGQAMLGLWCIHSSPMRQRLHTAFRVDLKDMVAAVERLRAAGIEPREIGGARIEEPVVLAWMPAASVYFDDPDGHSLEFICMLPDDPRPDLGTVPLSMWRAAQAAVG
ncbi:VOC family protein [Limobrevibacterium gyesilva]|uniref:VOC family protein n=1 Tax=Limobrevibacterium gyesilva TaxID=2991712 RepID=A0AA41YLC8_9PROT|nr:VOC family protein [Limobrevibacterium gyesilva]MCW3474536.1 VOC family protein [Limobrevibacterium gyesilva]